MHAATNETNPTEQYISYFVLPSSLILLIQNRLKSYSSWFENVYAESHSLNVMGLKYYAQNILIKDWNMVLVGYYFLKRDSKQGITITVY